MAFMQHQITNMQKWYQVDTRNEGIVNYPAYYLSLQEIAEIHNVDTDEIETIIGYGARLSAPGYMDCTEWVVFDTYEEAEDYLTEMYGD